MVAALLGCGADDREEQLRAASRELSEARGEVDAARARVEERRAALETAREKLAEAEKRLAEAESRVDVSATDDALFRTIQRRLLDDEALADVAVAAHVERGVVTLSGTVPRASLRDRAVEIASEVPGVASVQSRIEVAGQEEAGRAGAGI